MLLNRLISCFTFTKFTLDIRFLGLSKMPINERQILSVISDLCQERQLMTSVSGSLRGAAIAGGSTFLGGLLMGPIGLAFGKFI